MSGAGQTLYLKIEQNCIVYERLVRLRDIAKAECADPEICRQVKEIELYQFHGGQRKDFVQVFSVLWVIRRIHQQYPDLEISSVGVPDFVVRYEPDPEKKWLQYLKVAALCVILFFGAAFTIMTFIKDVSADEVFEQFYQRLTGTASTGITPLEVSFCIGLAAGIMIFYNHVGRKKLSDDLTPVQVAMRTYEEDVDTAYIENCSRRGESHDVDD